MERLHLPSRYPALLDQLRADCESCCGLCCVALYYARCDGFPADKPAGKPCGYLTESFRCGVHPQLGSLGLKGCRAYDCFGAGQVVTRTIYRASNWRDAPAEAERMFRVYLTVWRLRQLLWYLLEASSLADAQSLSGALDTCIQENLRLISGSPAELDRLDLAGHHAQASDLLHQAWSRVCARLAPAPVPKGKDLLGARLKNAALSGADFSNALLIAADLEGACLYGANFLAADLRDANLRNTDLRDALFLTQAQLNAARGNAATRLPPSLHMPDSWHS